MKVSIPQKDGWIGKRTYGDDVNTFEKYQENEYYKAILKCSPNNRKLALDLGGHIGIMTRRMCQDFEHVHVFEPLFHEHIGKNVRYDNYTVHPYAVSNKEGSAAMRVGQHHSAGSNIVTEKKGGQTYQDVPLVTIDSYDFKNVGFIKIDVEDHEYQTLQGAQKTIKRYAPTIMIELKNDNTYYNDIMKFMNDLNYNNERIGELDYVFFR